MDGLGPALGPHGVPLWDGLGPALGLVPIWTSPALGLVDVAFDRRQVADLGKIHVVKNGRSVAARLASSNDQDAFGNELIDDTNYRGSAKLRLVSNRLLRCEDASPVVVGTVSEIGQHGLARG